MTWGFEIGRLYNRRNDIHARFGGQQQGGIITPADYPLVMIVTGDTGLTHGYADGWRPDGVFEYFGEGQVGDMEFRAGNKAILEHSAAGEELLLFQRTSGGLRFEGELVLEGFRIQVAPDRNGNNRNAIVFELRSLNSVSAEIDAKAAVTDVPLDELRRRAISASRTTAVSEGTTTSTVYSRSRAIRDYALARSNGHCEGCKEPAPFSRIDGGPYLEVHHLRRLSDGGPDHPQAVIALCPNCHRRVHFGSDGRKLNEQFTAVIGALED